MIVLLSCSTSLSSRGQTINSSTGGFTDDSIKVAINDLRKANIKIMKKILIKNLDELLQMIVYLQNKLDKDIWYWIGHARK